jgi:hypothetical protein
MLVGCEKLLFVEPEGTKQRVYGRGVQRDAHVEHLRHGATPNRRVGTRCLLDVWRWKCLSYGRCFTTPFVRAGI